jgi:Zn-dependent protease with chaperone function
VPGARLVIRDADFVAQLVARNKGLKGGYSMQHLSQVAVWTIGGLIACAVLYLVLVAFLPQKVAFMLPEKWRNRAGDQIVQSITEGGKQCHTPAGDAAKAAMVAAIAEGNPDLPPLSFEVYNIPVLNAFAAPGGKIIFTKEILAQADAPDEIAGVLAHEIGHVYYRHPETQLVRMTGLQIVVSVMSGSNGGSFGSNAAALAALLEYSREAETQADAFAQTALDNAHIDPMGLKRFFEKILKIQNKDAPSSGERTSVLSKIGNIFSTHPGTAERIKLLKPLPDGVQPVTIMSPEAWAALKAICG